MEFFSFYFIFDNKKKLFIILMVTHCTKVEKGPIVCLQFVGSVRIILDSRCAPSAAGHASAGISPNERPSFS